MSKKGKMPHNIFWDKEYLKYENIVKDCEKWEDFNERVDYGMFRLLTYVGGSPILVSHGQFIKTFLKQRSCWGEDWTNIWTGDDRPPIKVIVSDDGVFSASIMESKNVEDDI